MLKLHVLEIINKRIEKDEKINVVGAVIIKDDKILCAQRGPKNRLPYKWEFPGGKIENNESPKDALQQEIMEELNCGITVNE